MEYGYVRVSTKEQNEDRQVIAMKEFGVQDHNIILDKQSGKDFDRPDYRRLVRKLKAGDILMTLARRAVFFLSVAGYVVKATTAVFGAQESAQIDSDGLHQCIQKRASQA